MKCHYLLIQDKPSTRQMGRKEEFLLPTKFKILVFACRCLWKLQLSQLTHCKHNLKRYGCIDSVTSVKPNARWCRCWRFSFMWTLFHSVLCACLPSVHVCSTTRGYFPPPSVANATPFCQCGWPSTHTWIDRVSWIWRRLLPVFWLEERVFFRMCTQQHRNSCLWLHL